MILRSRITKPRTAGKNDVRYFFRRKVGVPSEQFPPQLNRESLRCTAINVIPFGRREMTKMPPLFIFFEKISHYRIACFDARSLIQPLQQAAGPLFGEPFLHPVANARLGIGIRWDQRFEMMNGGAQKRNSGVAKVIRKSDDSGFDSLHHPQGFATQGYAKSSFSLSARPHGFRRGLRYLADARR